MRRPGWLGLVALQVREGSRQHWMRWESRGGRENIMWGLTAGKLMVVAGLVAAAGAAGAGGGFLAGRPEAHALLAGVQLPAGPVGPRGPAGPAGAPGADGLAGSVGPQG